MLHLWHNPRTHEPRLYIQGVPCEAWIAEGPYGTGWVLWVRHRPHSPASQEKCPTQIEIASRLRAWLLHRYHRRLFTTSFRELYAIARKS